MSSLQAISAPWKQPAGSERVAKNNTELNAERKKVQHLELVVSESVKELVTAVGPANDVGYMANGQHIHSNETEGLIQEKSQSKTHWW